MTAPTDARVVQLSDRRAAPTRALPEPVPTTRESLRRLAAALCTFGRELRAYGGVWLRSHRIGYVERARAAGYVEGYCDGLNASPYR